MLRLRSFITLCIDSIASLFACDSLIEIALIFLLLGSGIITVSLVVYATRLEGRAGIAPMAVVFTGIAIWSFAYVIELSAESFDMRLTAAKVSYVGIVLIPGSWFVFALEYTGRRRWISKRLILALTIAPLIALTAVWTNDFHHLRWTGTVIHRTEQSYWIEFKGGPFFWVHSIYSYNLLLVGMGLVFREAIRLPGKLRKQGFALIFVTLTPFFGSMLHVLGISPFGIIDPAPITALISSLMMIVIVRRLKLLQVLPIGREVIMKNFRDGMIIVDENSVIVDINQTAEQIIGLTLNDVVLKNAKEIFGDRGTFTSFDFTSTLGLEHGVHIDPVLGVNGLHYHPVVSNIDDGSDRMLGRLVIFRDISDRMEVEKQVAEARSQFLSTISHELRTPLTVISAFADILVSNREQILGEKQIQQVSAIQRSSRNMNALISDLLDVSHSDGGRLTIEPVEFELTQVIRDIEINTQNQLDAKNQQLLIEMNHRELYLVADELRFIQIVTNLVTNASKYSAIGKTINLDLDVLRSGIRLSVADEGIGISTEDMSKMFTPFFRAENAETRSQPGTGLGLSIVKSVVELHDGEIEIDSVFGVGTKVTFWIPGLIDKTVDQAVA